MTMQEDTRDRVITVESDLRHLTKTVDVMDEKLTEIHELVMQGRGIRWFLVAAAGVGGFIAGAVGFIWPWLHK